MAQTRKFPAKMPDDTLTSPLPASLQRKIVDFRRDMHQNPELSGHEKRAAGKIRAFLEKIGIATETTAVAHSVIGRLPGKDDSKGCIALRADTDALPIHEKTGLPFASKVDGVMHACGHDGHTSILLGAASLLAKEELPVPVKLIFQPAEEIGQGARAMIQAGVLDDVALIFGGHIDRHYPLGTIVVHDGAVNASSDAFRIEIRGKGGHGARPHETVDAVVVGSLLVMAIQTIVSREVNPDHPSVVTVGQFAAGTAGNVIADRSVLSGTIRAQDPEVREFLHAALERIATSVGQLHGAQVDVEIEKRTPPVINSPEIAEISRTAAKSVVGAENVLKMAVANMGGEDFGYFMEQRPGCYVRFGSVGEGQEPHPAHSSWFDFDERTLGFAAAYYQALVKDAAAYLLGGGSE